MSKLDVNKMMAKNLDFLAKYGIKSIQLGSTTYKKDKNNELKVTKKRKRTK